MYPVSISSGNDLIFLQQLQGQQSQHTLAQPAAAQQLLPPGRSILMPQPMPHLPGVRVLLRQVSTVLWIASKYTTSASECGSRMPHAIPTSLLSSLRAPGAPTSVRMDKLSVYSLQRLATLLVAANAAAATDLPPVKEQQAAQEQGTIVITNCCPVPLRVRQVGSHASVTLESQSTRCGLSAKRTVPDCALSSQQVLFAPFILTMLISLPPCRRVLWDLSPELAPGAERRIQLSECSKDVEQAMWSQPAEVQEQQEVSSCRFLGSCGLACKILKASSTMVKFELAVGLLGWLLRYLTNS